VKADQNWPGLVVRNGSGGKTLVFTDKKAVALEGYDRFHTSRTASR